MTALEKVLRLAEDWVGYLEKSKAAYTANPSVVYQMEVGAGRDNYTMTWEDTRPSFQGQSWCMNFMYWLFFKCFGADMAKKVLYLDSWNSYEPWTNFACYSWAQNFQNHGQRYQSSTAKVGDLIFFTKSHVGIVYDIKDGYVYTIEGNTSATEVVVSNGGGVWKKKYKLGIDAIYCYGRPNYAAVPEEDASADSAIIMPTLKKGKLRGDPAIYTFQYLMEGRGYYTDGVDGSYGGESVKACKRFQEAHNLPVTGICDGATWNELLTKTKKS